MVGNGIIHNHPGVPQDGDGHVDVVQAGHRLADVLQMQAVREPCPHQEERRDELRRRAGVDHQVPTTHFAGAVHHEREGGRGAAVLGRNCDAQGFQGLDGGAHRPVPGVGVAVEQAGAVAKRSERRDKAHHRAGKATVDPRCGRRRVPAQWSDFQIRPVGPVAGHLRNGGTELAQRLDHERRVP